MGGCVSDLEIRNAVKKCEGTLFRHIILRFWSRGRDRFTPPSGAIICLALSMLQGCVFAAGDSARPERWRIEDWRDTAPRRADAAAWQPGPDAPEVAATSGGLRFAAPFSQGHDRFYWDRDVSLDLSGAHGIEVVYRVEPPEAFRGITLYARSGRGWHAAMLAADRDGRRTESIPLERFTQEDTPGGWARVDRLRWSPWAGNGSDGVVIVESIRGYRAGVAVVMPGASSPNAGERAFGQRLGQWFADELQFLGLPVATLDDDAVIAGGLAGMRLAVLPYNPEPPAAQIRALRDFVAGGGKLIVCYSLNTELAELLGVRLGAYRRADRPGQWHAMAFDDSLPGAPERALQTQTRNLITALPAGNRARVIAWWLDDAGRRQPEAAWLLSDTGAWKTHVVFAEDAVNKRRMLLAIVAALLPDARDPAVRAMVRSARMLGGREGVAGAVEMIAQTARRHQRRLPDGWQTALERRDASIARALADGQPFRALDLADALQTDLARFFAMAQPVAPAGEVRAVWDHYGYGLHAGDWNRTADTLRQAGFTDVFLFVGRERVTRPQAPPEPLRTALQATRENGPRLHAWKILWNLEGMAPERIRRLEADGRLQVNAEGQTSPWLCPTQPENRALERADALRMAQVPGVAGLHLDYVRYPDAAHCYCPACRRAFSAHLGREVARWPAEVRNGPHADAFLRWRADRISTFVAELSDAVRALETDLVFSVAVFPLADRVPRSIGQDWPAWLRAGWVDWVTPMNYTEDATEFARWIRLQQALPGAGGRILPGIGVTASTSRLSPADAISQIGAVREAGLKGFVLFDLNHTLQRDVFPALNALPGTAKIAP